MNTGQTCVAPDYVLVHHSVKDALLKKMKATIKKFYGKDNKESVDYGRIINTRQFDRLEVMLEKNATELLLVEKKTRDELFIAPTLFDEIDWTSPLMEDELFGPLLPILTYDNLGEAIHQVRKLPKSLAAYMFTENEQAVDYFVENLSFGGGCINDTVSHVGNTNLPFGGIGTSGLNAYHGKASFEVFTHAKSMMNRSTKIPMRLAFPPYQNKLKIVKSLIQ